MVFTKDWVKERWQRAREYKEFYKNTFNQDISVREFYKNQNPLLSNLKKVKLTYELDYREQDYEFFIQQDSIEIIAPYNYENLNIFEDRVKDSIASIFKGKAYTFVKDNLKVDVNDVRGVEVDDLKYYDINIDKLKESGVYISKIPKEFIVGKGKNKIKSNKNKYDLNLWL